MIDETRCRSLLTIAALVVAVQGCPSDTPAPAVTEQPAGAPTDAEFAAAVEYANRYDCPLDSLIIPVEADSPSRRQIIRRIDLAGVISNIPEFHDCQRFIEGPEDARVYGAAYAIYASSDLPTMFLEPGRPSGDAGPKVRDSLPERRDTMPLPAERTDDSAVAGGPKPIAAAVIYSWGGTYGHLGIQPHFNCVRVWRGPEWRASVTPAGTVQALCSDAAFLDTARNTRLWAFRTPPPEFSGEEDYPPVARWQRDARDRYTIGIRCGRAWCTLNSIDHDPERPLPPLAPKGRRRTRVIAGWHDRQMLAIPVANPAAGQRRVRPSLIEGIAIPDSLLEQRTPAEFDAGWVHVSTIELRSTTPDDTIYKKKLNLDRGENNRVYLRKDPGTMEFRALIVSDTGDSVLFQVTRRDHTGLLANHGIRIVGTNRWRWKEDDETLWTRCLEGCCEVIRK